MLSYTTSIWFEWELFRIFFILLSDNLYFSLNVPSHQCNCLAIDSHHTIVIVPSTRRTIFFMPKNDDKKPKNHVLTQKKKTKINIDDAKAKKIQLRKPWTIVQLSRGQISLGIAVAAK